MNWSDTICTPTWITQHPRNMMPDEDIWDNERPQRGLHTYIHGERNGNHFHKSYIFIQNLSKCPKGGADQRRTNTWYDDCIDLLYKCTHRARWVNGYIADFICFENSYVISLLKLSSTKVLYILITIMYMLNVSMIKLWNFMVNIIREIGAYLLT